LTTTLISIVLADDYMNLCCDKLCTDSYIYKLNEFNFTMGGEVSNYDNPSAIFLFEQKNPLTNNIVYDYILNSLGGETYYGGKR